MDLYDQAGVDLTREPLVGLGSVCRRQASRPIAELVATLHGMGLRLHGFGVSLRGLDLYGPFLASADSLAWSARARHRRTSQLGCRTRGTAATAPTRHWPGGWGRWCRASPWPSGA